MSTLSDRLREARQKRGYSQENLAVAIGVTRGVIINLEYEKADIKKPPQEIVLNAICQELRINKDWLRDGVGEMELPVQDSALLRAIHKECSEMSDAELRFIYSTIQAMKEMNLERSRSPQSQTRALNDIVEDVQSRQKSNKSPGRGW